MCQSLRPTSDATESRPRRLGPSSPPLPPPTRPYSKCDRTPSGYCGPGGCFPEKKRVRIGLYSSTVSDHFVKDSRILGKSNPVPLIDSSDSQTTLPLRREGPFCPPSGSSSTVRDPWTRGCGREGPERPLASLSPETLGSERPSLPDSVTPGPLLEYQVSR